MGEIFRFDYYYGMEAEQFSFYRVPRILIKDKRFNNLSSKAKLLYGLMLDRMCLSMKNGWLDKDNKVYIYYTVESIMNDLSCAKTTAVKVLAELDSKRGIGLVEKKRQGLGKPDIIYVKNFATARLENDNEDITEENSSKNNSREKKEKLDRHLQKTMNHRSNDELDVTEESRYFSCSYETKNTEVQGHDGLSESEIAFLRELGVKNPQEIAKETISIHGQVEVTDFTYPLCDIPYENSEIECFTMENVDFGEDMQGYTGSFDSDFSEIQDVDLNCTLRSSEIEFQEVQTLDFKKFEMQTSRSSESELLDVQELDPNYTDNNYIDKNYIEMNYNNPIYPSSENGDRFDRLEESSAYISIIKENIDYDNFMQDKKWKDRELYQELFELICEIVCVKRKSVRVGGENYPYELVKSKFLKLNSSHLTYAMECMQKTASKIRNIRAYMITVLCNASNTINHYYQQAVQHDMYGGGWEEVGIV